MATMTATTRTSRVDELAAIVSRIPAPGTIVAPDGTEHRIGVGEPVYRVAFRTPEAANLPLNEFLLGKAYVAGELDLDGDLVALLDVREHLKKGVSPSAALQFLRDLVATSATAMNAKAIDHHYTLGDDFYLTFIDQRYRFYSHCLFPTGQESLEDAAECKLESMWRSLELRPGMRLLDIGGGWGGVMEYCSPRGVHTTSLTLAQDSAGYIKQLRGSLGLDGDVVVEDILDHRPRQKYDHAVIFGVIEHIPQYRRFCQRVWDALEPGGRLYLDASATKEKWAVSPFTRHYTWQGTHSFLSLQDMVRELVLNGFEVLEVKCETVDYARTIREWANRLEDAHEALAGRWGEQTYRGFRVFLRGGQHAFQTNRLQAYHLVAQRLDDPGPRPGLVRRLAQGAALFT
jgi:cyclopropane-fatty-acyl-phospholipid synthase